MLAWIARLSLLSPAAALIAFGAAADGAWFERHVALPALNPPPPWWTLAALRIAAVAVGVVLAACAAASWRRATLGGMLRVGLAAALALCASEPALRILRGILPVPATRIEARLAVPDPRTGWAFVPRRSVDLPAPGGVIRYAIDAHGDRAPSADWVEDTEAPTVLLAGESIATGHGLQWSDTIAARLSGLLHAQVVDVAEGGYGSDQAHLRIVDAIPRFAHPIAVVTTVLPVQLFRNLHDDRPHLLLRDGALILAPASGSRLRLRQLFVNDLPYLSEARLQESLTLTAAILHATATAARARGARPLFVFPSTGPPRPLDAHPEAFIVHALLDDLPHVVVDIDQARMLPWNDGHPDAEGARQIAAAIAEALRASEGRPVARLATAGSGSASAALHLSRRLGREVSMEMILRERQRNAHRCPECSASFEVAYFDDRRDARADLPEVLAEVACPRCGRSRAVSVPAGAERTLEVELDEVGETDEGTGD